MCASMRPRTRRRQRGFTAAELPVVLFLSGMFIALLLPAVQQAREAARRSQCQNNLHHLAIALHNYHDAYKVFPPGWVHQAPQRSNYGWATSLLPFVEQLPLYNELNMGRPPLAEALADPQRERLHQTLIANYRCPSDVGPPLNSHRKLHDRNDEPRTVALANYVAINGGGDWTRGQELRGCFGENSATRVREITDGMVNTLSCGERSWRVGPRACAAAVYLGVHGDGKLVREDDALAIGLYPLNAQEAVPDGDRPQCATGLASLHPGGVQVSFVDGAVRFLADDIDHDLLQHLMDKADDHPIRLP